MSEPSIYDIIINPECLASLLDLALTIGSGNSLYLWDKERFVVAEVAWTVFFIGSFVVLMGLLVVVCVVLKIMGAAERRLLDLPGEWLFVHCGAGAAAFSSSFRCCEGPRRC